MPRTDVYALVRRVTDVLLEAEANGYVLEVIAEGAVKTAQITLANRAHEAQLALDKAVAS